MVKYFIKTLAALLILQQNMLAVMRGEGEMLGKHQFGEIWMSVIWEYNGN